MRTNATCGLALAAAAALCLATIGCDGGDDTKDATVTDLAGDSADVPAEAAPDAAPEVPVEAFEETSVETIEEATGDVPPELPPAEPSCYQGLCAADPTHAPDPREMGPFPVGVSRQTFIDPDNPNPDGSPRTLVTEFWYPTTEEWRGKPVYSYDPKSDGTDAMRAKYKDVDIGTFPCDAVWGAPVRVGEKKWPLVLFSHGAFGIRYQSTFFTVLLASHGYVVVAPDHQDNTLYEIMVDGWAPETLVESAVRRPVDLLYLMDAMARKTEDPADPFYQRVDTDTVASTGHSFGGLTSYAITGDPRIKAIVPMSPEASMVDLIAPNFGSPAMAELSIPTMMMGGVMDKTLDFTTSQWNPWNEQKTPKWFLKVNRGGHYTFTDICRMKLADLAPLWGDAEDAMEDGCDPVNNWDFNEAHEAVAQYAVSFLNRFIRGSEGSAEFMTAEAGARYGTEIEFFAEPL